MTENESAWPPYRGQLVEAIERTLPDGSHVLRLKDGSHALARPARVLTAERECSQKALRDWRGKLAASEPDDPRITFIDGLLSDARTESFWRWVRQLRPEWWRNVHTITDFLCRATRLPQKPGDMSPKQREAYMARVRELATELQQLLVGTRFDYTAEREVSDSEMERPLSDCLHSWGEDEDDRGHVVSFKVTRFGAAELDYLFPQSALTSILDDLIDWTEWDDHWGRSIFHSSAPLVQANSKNVRAQYFACSVWESFHSHGVDIPYGVLAGITEVALKLGPDEVVDEGTVKKRIARYKARRTEHEWDQLRVDTEMGQISLDGEDFVLSGHF